MTAAQEPPSTLTAQGFAADIAEMLTASPKGRHWVAALGLREHPGTFTITTASGQRFRVAVDECRGVAPGARDPQ